MELTRGDIEIMAPVGSYESLMAAIQAGTDSVYFGVEKLNMRGRSTYNFSLEDMKKIVYLSGEAGVKTYLTLNTVVFDEELLKVKEIVKSAKAAGVSAIIAADMGVISYCLSEGVEVHMSTQVNITNFEEVKFYSRFADVMVMAREMSLEKIREISEKIETNNILGPSGKLTKLEIFVHGALCMAISGKCYLSLHEMRQSANRGSCMQLCRRAYSVVDKETGKEFEVDNEYIMSPKDVKTIHFLNKVLDSGVKVLKIEGRARSPEYVKTTVECYREAVDSYFDGSFSDSKIKEWDSRLAAVFNRGFWDGYYLGQRLGEWSSSYGSEATTRKLYIGKGTNYFTKLGVAEFKLETGSLKIGDEVMITGPTTGVIQTKVKEMRVDDKVVSEAEKGEFVSILTGVKIRRSDKLFKVVYVSQTDGDGGGVPLTS